MSKFIVVAFPDEARARQGIQALKDLNSDHSLALHGAGIVTKDDKGNVSMDVVADERLRLAASGAMIGGLGGLGVGLLATAVLAAGGAVVGAAIALTNRGRGEAIMKEVSRLLDEDSAVLVADVDADHMRAIESRMKAIGGTVHHQKQRLD